MLSKWSAPVDQNLGSESRHSQLSVAIFIAPRTHLGAQKCFTYQKKCKNGRTRVKVHWLVYAAIYIYIAHSAEVNKSDSCV